MANNKIRVTDLDFAEIKTNLVSYLSGQDTLKDYNFEGSALSTLVNILAYNTHYNAVLANLIGNEMFLDSAVTRSAIVSKATELNYVPKSVTSAMATVNITVRNVPGNPQSVTLPKNTKFTTSINGKSYSFITNSSYIAPNISNVYTFSNVQLFEGVLSVATFAANSSGIYTLPTDDIDVGSLSVLVQESSSNLNVEPYLRCMDITGVTASSQVFFVQGYKEYSYQIYFGDNVIGKRPSPGNIVIVEYIKSSGNAANNAKVFGRFGSTTIGGSSNITISTITQSTGGQSAESSENVKYNAVKSFTAQNRMVTPDDYKILLKQELDIIKSISVWGGEDNNPPDFGAVYICIEPTNSDYLSETDKQYIINYIIHSKKIIGIRPKIVDAQYIYLKINCSVYYNYNKTNLTDTQLASNVLTTIKNYNTNNLEKFDGVFRYSALSSLIDNTDPSIVSNITTMSMHQYLIPNYNKPTSYTINFLNPIYQNEFKTAENSFRSSRGFRISGDNKTYYFEDDGDKYIRLFYYNGTEKIFVKNNIGTIDYINGTVKLNTISISSIDLANDSDVGLEIIAVPMSNDVIPVGNMIIKINDSDIKTSAIVDTISSGYNVSGSKYIFTESR
jgi:hypothetical protein